MAPKDIAKKAEPFMARIENIYEDIEREKSAFMSTCKELKQDIKDILAEAEEAGVPKKALKGLVKFREFERKQAKIDADFEGEDQSVYDALILQLGPLGEAAATRARKNGNAADAEARPH